MKRAFFSCFVACIAFAVITSFKTNQTAPKLYPELEAYFKTVDSKQIVQSHEGFAKFKI